MPDAVDSLLLANCGRGAECHESIGNVGMRDRPSCGGKDRSARSAKKGWNDQQQHRGQRIGSRC